MLVRRVPSRRRAPRSAGIDLRLRTLAESGARVRREAGTPRRPPTRPSARAEDLSRPRAVIAAGPDSRLLRAVLEPLVPGAVRGLARRRAARLGRQPRPRGRAGPRRRPTPAPPPRSPRPCAAAARSWWPARRTRWWPSTPSGRWSTILPTATGDQLATAVVMLTYLDRVGLGPRADADAGRRRPSTTSPSPAARSRDLAVNPAKMLAIALADANPAGLGRLGARRPRRAPGRGVHPPRQRPHRARRRRRAPAAGHRGHPAPRRLRRPLRRRRGRAAPAAARARRRRRGRRGRASSAAGCRPRPPTPAASGSRRSPAEAASEVARYASLVLTGTYAARVPPPRPRRGLSAPPPGRPAWPTPPRRPGRGPRPLVRQRQDGAGDPRRPRATAGPCCPLTGVTGHLYDFLYAWHVPAFVFVTGYLSRSFQWEQARASGSSSAPWSCPTSSSRPRSRCSASTSAASARGPLRRPALADVVPLRAVLLAAGHPVLPRPAGAARARRRHQPGRGPARRATPSTSPGCWACCRSS